MKTMRMRVVMACAVLAAGFCLAAETNLLSFSYSTSIPADGSTPDTWLRKLNDGYWTNSAADGVRYGGDVTVTLDLAQRVRLRRVDVSTFTVTNGTPLSTQGVSLECSDDAAAWISLGALPAVSNGLFSGDSFFAKARYLRLTCAKGSVAGQSLAEIVVAGSTAGTSGLLGYSYTTSMPFNPAHTDPSLAKLYDGLWTNAGTHSVQYGPNSTASVTNSDPAYCIASNVVVSMTLSSVRKVCRAHVYAYRSTGSGGYGTLRVTLSNSLDGVSWNCAGQQTVYENSFPGYIAPNTVRFDFFLPNVETRYLAFACEKLANANITRQLLGEIQLYEAPPLSLVGAPLPFTYEFSKAPSVHVDKTECPKLTDGVWASNTRNAVRIYGDNVAITADLGAPKFVAGTDLLGWAAKFGSEAGYYGTGRVVVNGSLDKTNWTELADITTWKTEYPCNHTATFTNPPYARYLRFDTHLLEDTPAITNTAQILGELIIFRPPSEMLGALPVEVTNVLLSAGFEADQIPDGNSASMLVKGGATNGWTFSYSDSANYAGFQRNNSTVSTNYSGTGYSTRYFAPEGYQTAVLMGSGTMEAQLTVPTNGTYVLRFQANSTVISSNTENGGYDFNVKLDGAVKGVVTITQLTNAVQEVYLASVSSGTHLLRFEGIKSKPTVTWGALIDNLKLMRYEVAAEQVPEQGREFVFVADSMTPLTLNYVGGLLVKELWLGGVLMPPAKYSAATSPTVFDGPGAVRYDSGTLIQVR